jgi:uncharacterized damage-inducible protein DinB
LLETIDKFEENELRYVAYPGGMPVGRVMLHIADAEEGWFRHAITRERDSWPMDYTLDNYPDMNSILQVLEQVHSRTEDYLSRLTLDDLEKVIDWEPHGSFKLEWIIWHVLEHEIHHRGELSLILGLLGREGLDV